MKFLRFHPFRVYLPQVVLVISLLGLYLKTLAPGLTWANGGSDGGDLIAAASTGGIPHPTGYPTYLLLARLFQLLPLGSLAFRTNLMSAVATSLAAGLLFAVVTRFLSPAKPVRSWLAGLAGGYAFGLAPLIWSQAVITEVYALHTFFFVLILFLSTYLPPLSESGRKRVDGLLGLVCSLAIGNHLTSLLIAPVALLVRSTRFQPQVAGAVPEVRDLKRTLRISRDSLRRQIVWLGIGLSVYLFLPLRALSRPAINWGNPVTPGRLWWLVSGQLYQAHYLGTSMEAVFHRLQAAASLLLQGFGYIGVVLGFVGLVLFFSASRLYALTTWTFIVSSLFAMLYGAGDSYVYLLPAFTSFAIWIALGLSGLVTAFARIARRSAWVLYLVYLLYIFLQGVNSFPSIDASNDLRAENFGNHVLASVPESAIVFSQGDEAVFTLWYFHFALGERSDLAVVATDLLHFDWYQEVLRYTYPSLVVPGPFPWPETIRWANPVRPGCFVQYTDRPMIDCAESLDAP